MKNAGQERRGSSALRRSKLLELRRCALLDLRYLALFGAIVFVVLFLLILSTMVGFYFGYADTLAGFFGHEKTDGLSAGGHFARNLGLGLLALGGIGMAAWRNREMSRQADAETDQANAARTQSRISGKQAEVARKHSEEQAEVARKQIENESNRIAGERFSDGVKMLAQNENSKPAIAARIGGIYALHPLANNYVSEYAAQVVKILVAYVRENTQSTKIEHEDLEMSFLGEDVKAAFAVLAQLLDARDESPAGEKKFKLSDNDCDFSDCDFSRLFLDYRQVSGLRHYRWQGSDLRGSDLRGANFRKARMHGAQLQGANLCGANLEGARLHNADLRGANLGMGNTDEKFKRTNLQCAELYRADLRGATFSDTYADLAADLSRADLDSAKFQDTDLREANLKCVKNLPKLSSDRIWHSDQSELEEVEFIEMSPDCEWDLESYRDCPYALAGVLRNFIYQHGLLKSARKLLDDNNLPDGFSGIWQKRLEEVDPETGDHPDWRK